MPKGKKKKKKKAHVKKHAKAHHPKKHRGGKIPLGILETRHARLGRLIKSRGGTTG